MVRIPNAENPFENAGLDRNLVEALLDSGDPSALVTAINGIRRVATKALHPDVLASGSSASAKDNSYLDILLQNTDKLASMSEADLRILAKAFTKKTATKRVASRKPRFESNEFHDGSLLGSIVDMLSEDRSSIQSARGHTYFIRPVNYSDLKPNSEAHSDADNNQWYPPATARVPIIKVDEEGSVTWRITRQVALRRQMEYDLRQKVDNEEFRQYLSKIKDALISIFEPYADSIANLRSQDSIFLVKKEDGSAIIQTTNHEDLHIPIDSQSELIPGSHPGIYVVHFDAAGGFKSLNDHYYKFEYEDSYSGDLYLVGSSDREYIDTINKHIFRKDDKRVFKPQLYASKDSDTDVPYLAVPDNMFKIVQRSYRVNILKNSQILATDDNGRLLMLGTSILD